MRHPTRTRTTVAAIATTSVVAALTAWPTTGQAAPDKGVPPDSLAASLLSQGVQLGAKAAGTAAEGDKPRGVNPFTGTPLNPSKVDYTAWREWADVQGDLKATSSARLLAEARALPAAPPPPLVVDELEPEGIFGLNDTIQTAQLIRGFGTGRRENPRVRILGQLSPQAAATPTTIPAAAEDDGAIPLAGETGVTALRRAATWTATIGDGPHGRAGTGTGDFDFRRVTLTAGQQLTLSTSTPTGPLDTVAAIWSADGELLAFNDDAVGLDSRVAYRAGADATVYAMVGGFRAGVPVPSDPDNPASGPGAGSEGPYSGTVSVNFPDLDWYAVDLDQGDIIGTSVEDGATATSIVDPDGVERMGSAQDFSFIYPASTPLPGGGNATTAVIAKESGRHYVGFPEGNGPYDATLEVYRTGSQTRPRVSQTLFIDYDGARVNTNIFGGPGVRTLSPLEAFIGGWGLGADDLRALQDAITASVRESVQRDLVQSGLNDQISVRIVDSNTSPDTFGQPGVTRLIVGGTIAESGISTIGIAQSIDPGNFERSETALILLDLLSTVRTNPNSLNRFITPATVDKIGFLGRAIGNITAHEAGHVIGSFHQDQFNALPALMDQGGNLANTVGVGPDGVGGTADDIDVDFEEDVFVENEGLTGLEDTAAITAFGLTR